MLIVSIHQIKIWQLNQIIIILQDKIISLTSIIISRGNSWKTTERKDIIANIAELL